MASKPEHKCAYAEYVGINPVEITDEKGVDRCLYCHSEWAPKPTTTKTVGGK